MNLIAEIKGLIMDMKIFDHAQMAMLLSMEALVIVGIALLLLFYIVKTGRKEK